MHEEVRAVVHVEEHDVPGPAWLAVARKHVVHVGDVQGAPLPLEPRQLGDQPGAGPADQRRRQLDDVGVPDPRVREHCPGRHPQAQAADEHPVREPVPPQGAVGQGDLGAGVDGVHREGAVDDELEHLTAPAQRHLAVRGVGARQGHRPAVARGGRPHTLDAGHAATVRTANGRARPVENHRWTRPFVRQ